MAGSTTCTLGTAVTLKDKADNVIQMLRTSRVFMIQYTCDKGGLVTEKPIFAKSKMERAEEAKMRQLLSTTSLKAANPR